MNEILLKLKTDKIRNARESKGLSQENVGAEIGLKQSQYSRIENGESTVSFERVAELSKVLDVSPSDIIEDYNVIFNHCNQPVNNIEKIDTINNNQDFENERKHISLK